MRNLFVLVFLLIGIVGYAQDEYVILDKLCLGNNDADQIRYSFQTPDGSTLVWVYVTGRNGDLESGEANSLWLLKFDHQMNLAAKKFIRLNSDYYFDGGFRVNEAGRTIAFRVDSDVTLPHSPMRWDIYDFDLNKVASAELPARDSIIDISVHNNRDGGYSFAYYLFDDNVRIDTVGVTRISPEGVLGAVGYISADTLEFYSRLLYSDGDTLKRSVWLTNVLWDGQYYYTTSIVFYGPDRGASKIGFLGLVLDSTMHIIQAKTIENRFPEKFGSATRNQLYQLNDSVFLYAFDDLFNTKLYFLNRQLDTLGTYAVYTSPLENRYNYILRNEFDFYEIQAFDIRVTKDRAYVPLKTYQGRSIFNEHYTSSSLLCFDHVGRLVREYRLDSIPFGTQQTILKYESLDDGAMLLHFWNVTRNASGYYTGWDYGTAKFDSTGRFKWQYSLPFDRTWKNKWLISQVSMEEPQVVKSSGRDRYLHLYRKYIQRDIDPMRPDTLQVWDMTLDLQDGRPVDSLIVATLFNTAVSGKYHTLSDVKRISQERYAMLGTSNALCTGRYIDVYVARSQPYFNTLVFKIYLDWNKNNQKDPGEPYYTHAWVALSKNGGDPYTHYGEDSLFAVLSDTGKYQASVQLNNEYFKAVPVVRTVNRLTYGHTDTLSFALQPQGMVHDLNLAFYNTFVTRPGFNGSYQLTVSNTGNTIRDGILKAHISSRLGNISADPPAIAENDSLVWNLPGILPSDQRTVTVYYTAVVPPDLNPGDTLISEAVVYPVTGDQTPANNRVVFVDSVLGSFDPNDKLCNNATIGPDFAAQGNYLVYTIRYENTGSDTAFSITITDTLDAALDIRSLKILKAVQPCKLTITDQNVMHFEFKPSVLPPGETGSVVYQVKPRSDIGAGTTILNRASIIFDYNLPVVTEYTTTTIRVLSDLAGHYPGSDDRINVYPNPSTGQFLVDLSELPASNYTISLQNLQGQVMWSSLMPSYQLHFQAYCQGLAAGLYILNIRSGHFTRQKVIEVIKE